MNWRSVTDWAKRSPTALRVADGLGRGRGRLRFLDHLNPPPRPHYRPDLADWSQRELSAVWLGHATVLLRVGGVTILTDPVLSHRVGVGFGIVTAGPRRHVRAALSVRELPPVDLLLISHAHFDHLDRPTLARLTKKTPVVTAARTGDLIRDLGFRDITELEWNQRLRIGNLSITGRKVKHWGARTFYDQFRGYNAYVIETSKHRVLYGGDTAYQPDFGDIDGLDLAILGIGAYDPYIQAHATPEQAWQMAREAGAQWLLPMHHATFRLSHEPMDEPINRMLAAAGAEADRVVIRDIGQEWISRN